VVSTLHKNPEIFIALCAMRLTLCGPLRFMNSSVSFIVRIYRFVTDKPHRIVGIVEEAGKKGKKAFSTLDELWEILNSSKEDRLEKKSRRTDEKK
jgi:hypothetical protein